MRKQFGGRLWGEQGKGILFVHSGTQTPYCPLGCHPLSGVHRVQEGGRRQGSVLFSGSFGWERSLSPLTSSGPVSFILL